MGGSIDDASAPVRRVGANELATLLGSGRGQLLGVAVAPGVGVGLSTGDELVAAACADPAAVIGALDAAVRPRWTWWMNDTAASLVSAGVRVATCWDVAAVHRLLHGGWRAEPARVQAVRRGLSPDSLPVMGQLDLLGTAPDEGHDADDPVRPDGHLRPEWAGGAWAGSPERLARWAGAARDVAGEQQTDLGALRVGGDARATARAESAAELLCAELSADGLPVDVAAMEAVIGALVGPRSRTEAEAATGRRARDDEVLAAAPPGAGIGIDLRNPAHVRGLLARVGVDVPDTRAWRLEPYRSVHPLVDSLLTWRKAERVSTTYGYAWLDEQVAGGRLRGAWTGCDGAAGRMTASAGLHNLPAELRVGIVAEAGHVFVRADLGQIEPRVLAAVSGDEVLARAARAPDLYAPIANRLNVERPIAKVAVLAAMYGQTSGDAGKALRAFETAYPVAMKYLRDADDNGRAGRDVRTFGGRLVRMWDTENLVDDPRAERSANAARGRYARNAVVQGAAAELFKAWAATVRARLAAHGAGIVLCLHDELLVHAPTASADDVVALLDQCLQEASRRWAPHADVRFVADIGVVSRWSDAKG